RRRHCQFPFISQSLSAVKRRARGSADVTRACGGQRADSVDEHRLRKWLKVVEGGDRRQRKAFPFAERKLAGNTSNTARDGRHDDALHHAIGGVPAYDEERPSFLRRRLSPPDFAPRY